MNLNALSYAMLSMLVRKPCSGYELKNLMDVFWQAKHSQIYPLLGKLEQDELVTFEVVGQSGKPDKKIYSITEKGISAVKEYIRDHSPSVPVNRDEFLIKVYAIGLTDMETAKRLFSERIAACQEKVAYRKEEIRNMEETYGKEIGNISSSHFGRYILFQRKLRLEQEEIEWCNWVLGLLQKNIAEGAKKEAE